MTHTSFLLILGGWISSVSDANQYLQVDFLTVMECNLVGIKGNADIGAFVRKFLLAESKNGITWTTVKSSTGGDMVSKSLRLSRYLPKKLIK